MARDQNGEDSGETRPDAASDSLQGESTADQSSIDCDTSDEATGAHTANAPTEIEHLRLADLMPYAANSRTHSAQQVGQIAASIMEFGFTNPVLIDEQGVIIAGHGRVMAAGELRLDSVPCIRLRHLTEQQKRAYVIADNQLALNAGWDEELLTSELKSLADADFDIDLLGFEADDIEQRLRDAVCDRPVQQDEPIPSPPQTPVTRRGDLWVLGGQRLLCGDSTNADDVRRLMTGDTAGLCFTSPPYAQQREYTADSDVSDWDSMMAGVFGDHFPGDDHTQVLVNLGLIHSGNEWQPYWSDWIDHMRKRGWKRFGWYVWDQGFGLPGNWNGRFGPSHEFVFHFNKSSIVPQKWVDKQPENIKPRNAFESTMRKADGTTVAFSNPQASAQPTKIPDSVIRIGRQVGSDGHPAQFPVALASAMLHSWPGDVYEPFSGSGTTMIAAEKLNRRCFAMEISPAYCDIAVERWQNMTGQKAIRASDGA